MNWANVQVIFIGNAKTVFNVARSWKGIICVCFLNVSSPPPIPFAFTPSRLDVCLQFTVLSFPFLLSYLAVYLWLSFLTHKNHFFFKIMLRPFINRQHRFEGERGSVMVISILLHFSLSILILNDRLNEMIMSKSRFKIKEKIKIEKERKMRREENMKRDIIDDNSDWINGCFNATK